MDSNLNLSLNLSPKWATNSSTATVTLTRREPPILDPTDPHFYSQFLVANEGPGQDEVINQLKTWEPYELAKLRFIDGSCNDYIQLLKSALPTALTSDDVEKNDEIYLQLLNQINHITLKNEKDSFYENKGKLLHTEQFRKRTQLEKDLREILNNTYREAKFIAVQKEDEGRESLIMLEKKKEKDNCLIQ